MLNARRGEQALRRVLETTRARAFLHVAIAALPVFPVGLTQDPRVERWIVDGVELRVSALRSRAPLDELLARWPRATARPDAALAVSRVGPWTVLGMPAGDTFVSVQLRPTASGTAGFAVRTPLSVRRERPAFPCSLPLDAVVVRTIEAPGTASSTQFMIRWNGTSNPLPALVRACRRDGWSPQFSFAAASAVAFLARAGATLDLVSRDVAGVTWVIAQEARAP